MYYFRLQLRYKEEEYRQSIFLDELSSSFLTVKGRYKVKFQTQIYIYYSLTFFQIHYFCFSRHLICSLSYQSLQVPSARIETFNACRKIPNLKRRTFNSPITMRRVKLLIFQPERCKRGIGKSLIESEDIRIDRECGMGLQWDFTRDNAICAQIRYPQTGSLSRIFLRAL